MTPTERYHRDLDSEGFVPDPAQAQAMLHTQRAYDDLRVAGRKPLSLLHRVRGHFGGRHAVKGLYLWGGVGRGKTYLVDSLFECLPFADKRRTHFHSFMQTIHRDLKGLRVITNSTLHVKQQQSTQRLALTGSLSSPVDNCRFLLASVPPVSRVQGSLADTPGAR